MSFKHDPLGPPMQQVTMPIALQVLANPFFGDPGAGTPVESTLDDRIYEVTPSANPDCEGFVVESDAPAGGSTIECPTPGTSVVGSEVRLDTPGLPSEVKIIVKSNPPGMAASVATIASTPAPSDDAYSCTGFTFASLAEDLHASFKTVCHAGNSNVTAFSKRDTGAHDYEWNASSWIAAAGLNLTGCCTSMGRQATLITPQHFLTASHWPASIGSTLRFVGADGTVHARTVVDLEETLADRTIGVLNAALPAGVTPYRIPGEVITYSTRSPGTAAGGATIKDSPMCGFWKGQDNDLRPIAIILNANGGASIFPDYENSEGNWGQRSAFTLNPDHNNDAVPRPPVYDDCDPGFRQPRSGDSSSPVFMVYKGEPLLWMCHHGETSGGGMCAQKPLVDSAIRELAKRNSSLGLGYEVGEVEITGYTTYP